MTRSTLIFATSAFLTALFVLQCVVINKTQAHESEVRAVLAKTNATEDISSDTLFQQIAVLERLLAAYYQKPFSEENDRAIRQLKSQIMRIKIDIRQLR